MDTNTESPSTAIDPQRIFQITKPDPKLLTYFFFKSLVTGPGFPFVFLYHYVLYRTLKYRFSEEGVNESWGKLWKKEIYLTYHRIQDIHISRDVFQRWMGLATIHIQTASGSSKPEMSIDGILEYEMLRDYLYSRMRGGQPSEKEQATISPPGGETDATSVLTEIRDELHSIRETLESSR